MNRKILKEIYRREQKLTNNLLDFFIDNIIKWNIKNVYYNWYSFYIPIELCFYYFMLNDKPEEMYVYCEKMQEKSVFARPLRKKAIEFVKTVILYFNFNLKCWVKYQYWIEENF